MKDLIDTKYMLVATGLLQHELMRQGFMSGVSDKESSV